MLLDDIITLLSDESHSITDALLKTKVLLADFEQVELGAWVNSELNGYDKQSELPDYRVFRGEVRGSVENIAKRYTNFAIPIMHLTREEQDNLTLINFKDGLPVIEGILAEHMRSGEGTLSTTIAPEFYGFLAKRFEPGNHITSARVVFSASQLKNITAQVRSRLLDFLLQLRAKVGRSTPDEELKKRAAGFDIANAFKQAVFQGPTNIHIGSHGTQTISLQLAVGDRAELKKALTDAGLPAFELEMLDKAIDSDIEKQGKASMEGATGHWYLDLLGKAAKGTVKIGVDVATAVVGAAITHYVGIS